MFTLFLRFLSHYLKDNSTLNINMLDTTTEGNFGISHHYLLLLELSIDVLSNTPVKNMVLLNVVINMWLKLVLPFLPEHPFQNAFGTLHLKWSSISSTVYHLVPLPMCQCFNMAFNVERINPSFAYFGANVFHSFVPIIVLKWIFALPHVCFSGIALTTMGIDVLTQQLIVFI